MVNNFAPSRKCREGVFVILLVRLIFIMLSQGFGIEAVHRDEIKSKRKSRSMSDCENSEA